MIATGQFVCLHLHKSGGTFVNECVLRFFADARRIGYHLPAALLPPELRTLPLLGFVRNPWSYYVSWYAFQSQRPRPNALFRIVSADGAHGFKGSVRNLLSIGDDSALLERVLASLPEHYGEAGFGLNLPRSALAPIRGSGLGFYGYLFDYMYAAPGLAPSIGTCENLRADLLGFFDAHGIAASPELRDFVRDAPRRNVSEHGDWRDYYDAELAALVATRDAGVIERFGYRFAPATAA
jgi:hypothetical protein